MRPPQEEDQFLLALRARGLRVTGARRALVAEIFSQHGHIDADQVRQALDRAGHRVSRATVYRNLDLLVACGFVQKQRSPRGRFVFEHVHAGLRHDHLICRDCGELAEFQSAAVAAMLREICRAHGFEPAGNQVQILGRCEACARAAAAGRSTRAAREHAGV